jgi:periplasmic protein TonB
MTTQRREQEAETRRRLCQGLGWSLVLHALVLGVVLTVPRLRDGAGSPAVTEGPLRAHLVRVAVPAMVPSAPTEIDRPRREPVVPPPALAVPKAGQSIHAVPPAPTLALEPAPAAAEPVPAANSAPPGPDTVVARPAFAVDTGAGADADALRGYRMALAVQARRFKRYPAQAQAAGWTGTAEVRLAIERGGRAGIAELARSSGHEALDQAALAMVDAAAQRAPVPPALQQQAFAVLLPVVFNLEE